MTKRGCSIGEAAGQSGVKVPTIRFYEQIGLLPAPDRTASNRRLYDDADINRLTFIRHARELGFEMEDIRELLALAGSPSAPCLEADGIARRHLDEVDRRIAQLTTLRSELQRMIDRCAHGQISDCRVIHTLADHSECAHEHGRI
jgi:DNA-binding transcriptional MerR regulator